MTIDLSIPRPWTRVTAMRLLDQIYAHHRLESGGTGEEVGDHIFHQLLKHDPETRYQYQQYLVSQLQAGR